MFDMTLWLLLCGAEAFVLAILALGTAVTLTLLFGGEEKEENL